MERPDLLIVLADQWRAQSCGWAGCADVRTPQLDAFARTAAVDCPLAVSATPVCTPARANLLTGLRPHVHGLCINDVPLDPTLPSLGKHFAAHGYDTAWIGKWHVDGMGRLAWIPPGRQHGWRHWMALECTHAYWQSRYYAHADPTQRMWPGYDAEAQTLAMIDWWRNGGAAPRAAVLSWGPPHGPYRNAPERHQALYDPERLALPGNVPTRLPRVRGDLAGYYAHISALDELFGTLLATVRASGRPTVVVFTSDHGDFVGAHGMYDKQGPWDEALRIPLLIGAPGLRPGTRNDSLIDLVDLWPTLCDLCGLPQPAGPLHGRNRAPDLRAGTCPADDAALYASYVPFGNWIGEGHKAGDPLYAARAARGVRTRRHTYVADRDGPWLLYDNATDPGQQRNLVGDPQHQDLGRDLAQRLDAELARIGDRFEDPADLLRRFGWDEAAINRRAFTGWTG